MAGFWRMRSHRRAPRYRELTHPDVVHLHFLSDAGLPVDCLYGVGILDEYQALHVVATPQPPSLALMKIFLSF